MLNVIILVVAVLLGGYLAFSKRLAGSSNWQATVTPLASIMGSGFLVSAPLLGGIVGNLAVVCMALLLMLAYAVGGAIRFNIKHFEPIENQGHGPAQTIAFLSRIVLGQPVPQALVRIPSSDDHRGNISGGQRPAADHLPVVSRRFANGLARYFAKRVSCLQVST